MKTGLIMFKSKNNNLRFNKSDNTIVKNGIIQYFEEQNHDEYCKYFITEKGDLLFHLNKLKDDLFNDNDLTESNSSSTPSADQEQTVPSIPVAAGEAALDITRTTLISGDNAKEVRLGNDEHYDVAALDESSDSDQSEFMDDEDSKSEIVHDNQSQASDCSLIKAAKRLSRKNDTQKEPPAK